MVIGVLTVDLFIGEANSLKEKRRVLKSVIDRIRSRFNVSIAEVAEQDTWQRSTLGVSFVSSDRIHADKVLTSVIRFIEVNGSVIITNFRTELL